MKTTFLFVFGISLLFIVGCATAPRPSELTSLPPSAVSSSVTHLLVISAVYGSGDQFADVTGRVNEMLHQPGVKFFVRPEWLNADPKPGWNKALIVVYELKGQRHLFIAGEGDEVSFKRLTEQANKQSKNKSHD
jgi:hypothetical protein